MEQIVDLIMKYEDGDMTEDQEIDFFGMLVETGMAWKLQGHYGRTAQAHIEAGRVCPQEIQ